MVKIGCDPEFFLKKDGKFVSAHGMIEGTKKNPQPVKDGAVQVDGMALEFNINPAETAEEFKNNIKSVLSDLRKMIPEEYEFCFVPVADFGREYIDQQPEEAKVLGCEPDFNAYTSKPNPTPDANKGFRTASGHIHIGWTEGQDITDPEHVEACEMFVKQMDWFLGIPSLMYDKDNTRRQLYGKAGAYRPKHYGVEYRVLSNFWLNPKNEEFLDYIFPATITAFDELVKGNYFFNSVGNAGYALNEEYNSIDMIIKYIKYLPQSKGFGPIHAKSLKIKNEQYENEIHKLKIYNTTGTVPTFNWGNALREVKINQRVPLRPRDARGRWV